MATCRHPCSRVTGCFMEAPGTGSSRGVLGWVDASVTWLFFVLPSPGTWGGKASLGVPSYGCCLAAFIPSGLCYLPCVVKGDYGFPLRWCGVCCQMPRGILDASELALMTEP